MKNSIIPSRYDARAAFAAWKAWATTYKIPMTLLAHVSRFHWPNAYTTLSVIGRHQELSVLHLARLYGAQEALPPTEIKGIVPDDLARAMIDEYPALRLQDWQAIVDAMRPYVRDGGKLYPKPEELA